MPVVYKDKDGKTYQVTEAMEISAPWLDDQIKEAELALDRLKDLKQQYADLNQADPGSAGVHPAAPATPAPAPTDAVPAQPEPLVVPELPAQPPAPGSEDLTDVPVNTTPAPVDLVGEQATPPAEPTSPITVA